MSKYKMNVYEVRDKLREYECLYNKAIASNLGDSNLSKIKEGVEQYQTLLSNYNVERQRDSLACDCYYNDYINDSEIIDKVFFNDYDSTNANCIIDGSTIKVYQEFQDYEDNMPLIVDPINFNNDDLLTITDEIIKSTDNKNFISYYEKSRKRTKLHIQYLKHTSLVKGCCLFNEIDPYVYVMLYRNNSLEDVVTSVHEMFHAIIIYYIQEVVQTFCTDKSAYVQEVEGYLADLIAVWYLKKLPHASNIILDNINDIIVKSKIMLYGMMASDNLDINGMINIGRTNAVLSQCGVSNPSLTRGNKYYYINDQFLDLSSNVCSFLTACDLFDIYLDDKEKAIYNLLKISELEPSNVVDGLVEHEITFMDDDFASFRKLNNKVREKKLL